MVPSCVKGCIHIELDKKFISIGASTAIIQDDGHRFYKKFSGESDIYALIDSEYPNGEECVKFQANILDSSSHIGIYHFENKARTVKSNASIYYYPVLKKAKSYTLEAGTKNLDVAVEEVPKVSDEKEPKVAVVKTPKDIDVQFEYRINKKTGTIGLYQENKKVSEMQNDLFKSGFNFFFVDLVKQGEYITLINTAAEDELYE